MFHVARCSNMVQFQICYLVKLVDNKAIYFIWKPMIWYEELHEMFFTAVINVKLCIFQMGWDLFFCHLFLKLEAHVWSELTQFLDFYMLGACKLFKLIKGKSGGSCVCLIWRNTHVKNASNWSSWPFCRLVRCACHRDRVGWWRLFLISAL